VQDLRIDLHEGFRHPPDADEADATAAAVGEEIARAVEARLLPQRSAAPAPLDARTGERALSMLDAAVSTLADLTAPTRRRS